MKIHIRKQSICVTYQLGITKHYKTMRKNEDSPARERNETRKSRRIERASDAYGLTECEYEISSGLCLNNHFMRTCKSGSTKQNHIEISITHISSPPQDRIFKKSKKNR